MDDRPTEQLPVYRPEPLPPHPLPPQQPPARPPRDPDVFVIGKRTLFAWLPVVFAAVAGIAVFLPWMRVFGLSVTGWDGDGKVTLGAAVLAAVAAIVHAVRRAGTLPAAWVTAAAGLVVAGVGGYDLVRLLKAAPEAEEYGFSVSPGVGLYLSIVAGLAVTVAAATVVYNGTMAAAILGGATVLTLVAAVVAGLTVDQDDSDPIAESPAFTMPSYTMPSYTMPSYTMPPLPTTTVEVPAAVTVPPTTAPVTTTTEEPMPTTTIAPKPATTTKVPVTTTKSTAPARNADCARAEAGYFGTAADGTSLICTSMGAGRFAWVGHAPVVSGTHEVGESCDPDEYLGKIARTSDNRGVMCMSGEWVSGP